MSIVDGLGRHYDVGVVTWMRTGSPPHRLFVLDCRHGRTSAEDFGDESEGIVMSRLISQHHDGCNRSEQSYKGGWLCYCEPHKAPGE